MNENILEEILNRLDKLDKRMENMENEMRDFKNEMRDFKNEMTDFKNEMTDFKNEMTDFKNETNSKLDSLHNSIIFVNKKIDETKNELKREIHTQLFKAKSELRMEIREDLANTQKQIEQKVKKDISNFINEEIAKDVVHIDEYNKQYRNHENRIVSLEKKVLSTSYAVKEPEYTYDEIQSNDEE